MTPRHVSHENFENLFFLFAKTVDRIPIFSRMNIFCSISIFLQSILSKVCQERLSNSNFLKNCHICPKFSIPKFCSCTVSFFSKIGLFFLCLVQIFKNCYIQSKMLFNICHFILAQFFFFENWLPKNKKRQSCTHKIVFSK